MTNPNNAVGTNGAFGGRTSVNAFNDDLASYSAGILSGWACAPDSGLDVMLGGDGNIRDVAIAEDNAGNKTTINNISGAPIVVSVDNPPTTNSRVDSVVAYVDNPPTGSATATDNYEACGLIVVAGTASSTPSAPNDSAIRTAITNDGASGTTAYYVVLANITVASGTTDLTSENIAQDNIAGVGSNNIDFTTFGGSTESPILFNGTKNNVGSSAVEVKSYTVVKSGLYEIYMSGGNGTGTSKGRINIYCLKNTTEIMARGAWSITAWSGNNFAECQTSGIFWLNKGDIISMSVNSTNVSSNVDWKLRFSRIY